MGASFTSRLERVYMSKLSERAHEIHNAFINGQWRWNALVTRAVILPSLALGFYASKVLDRGLIETVGPYGLSQSITAAGRDLASYDTSIVTSYALYIVIGFVGLALVLIAPSGHVVSMLVFGTGFAMLPIITRST